MVDRLLTNRAKMSSAQGFVVIRCQWIFSEIHYSGFQLSPKASQSFWSWSTVLNGRPGCKIKRLNVQHKAFYRVQIETNNCKRSMSLNKAALTEGLNGVTVSRKTATKSLKNFNRSSCKKSWPNTKKILGQQWGEINLWPYIGKNFNR